MVYLDSSVVLAHLLSEDRIPTDVLLDQPLASSRLMEYEVRQRFHSSVPSMDPTLLEPVFERVAFVELVHDVVFRSGSAFPVPVRTLDALHLATADFLRVQGARVSVATYDVRMSHAAQAMGFELFDLGPD